MDNDVLKCTEALEPFSKGMGVYLTPEEVEYIKVVLIKQRQYIEQLEIHIQLLQKENQECITGIGQL